MQFSFFFLQEIKTKQHSQKIKIKSILQSIDAKKKSKVIPPPPIIIPSNKKKINSQIIATHFHLYRINIPSTAIKTKGHMT